MIPNSNVTPLMNVIPPLLVPLLLTNRLNTAPINIVHNMSTSTKGTWAVMILNTDKNNDKVCPNVKKETKTNSFFQSLNI
jgi:hypothetical protein